MKQCLTEGTNKILVKIILIKCFKKIKKLEKKRLKRINRTFYKRTNVAENVLF